MTDHTFNGTYYSYKTIMSYMNAYDPNDTTKIASFNSSAKIKLILTLPAFGVCNQDSTPHSAYYKTPTSEMMKAFETGLSNLGDLEASIPSAISNFSASNNIVYLDDMTPCAETDESVSVEAPMDITAGAMMAQGCQTEFWVSKYSLLGLLAQTLTRAKDTTIKAADETWIFSLSWGTYGLCDMLKRQREVFKVDLPQDCSSIVKGCPDGATSCTLSNREYINACEDILKELTESYKCIFFVSSGDDGPISSDGFTSEPYYVDYPTSSKYVISAGGVNYTAQAPSGQSTSITNFAKEVDKNAVGFATPTASRGDTDSAPTTVVGGLNDSTNGIMATGGGFTGYGGNDTSDITAREKQIPFIQKYQNTTTAPQGYTGTWDSTQTTQQRGTPDISAIMSNGATVTWNNPSKGIGSFFTSLQLFSIPVGLIKKILKPITVMFKRNMDKDSDPYAFENADGTSLSSPVLAGFFALLLSNQSLPSGTQLIDFIYDNPSCFDKPDTAGQNSFTSNDGKVVDGFTSTPVNGTWDPCVGLGVPNYQKLLAALKAASE